MKGKELEHYNHSTKGNHSASGKARRHSGHPNARRSAHFSRGSFYFIRVAE